METFDPYRRPVYYLIRPKICSKLLIVITNVRAYVVVQSHGQRRDSIKRATPGTYDTVKYDTCVSNKFYREFKYIFEITDPA